MDYFQPPKTIEERTENTAAKPEEYHPIHDIPTNSVVFAVAQYFYEQAPRQNRTIAVVAALMFWAGLVGRNINVSGDGLNMYVAMIAGTGRGKETISKGPSRLAEEIAKTVPAIRSQITGRFASSQAIFQHLQNNPSTLSIQSEGEYLSRRMTSPKASQNEQDVLQAILDLYHKSGYGASLPGYRKANVADSVGSIPSPCFSLLTESTFGAVDALLGNDSIKKGLTPRFLIVMTKADRAYANPRANEAKLDPHLIEYLAGVYSGFMAQSNPLTVTNVTFSVEASEIEKQFDRETTQLINKGGNGTDAELWNRSHLIALKLAALVASGINHVSPHIDAEVMRWAIKVERHCVEQLLAEMESGEIGESTEDLRVKRVVNAIEIYVKTNFYEFAKGYRVNADLHAKTVVTFTYLYNRLGNTAPFRKNGYKEPAILIRDALKILVEKGDLEHLHHGRMQTEFGQRVEGWIIANVHSFDL